MANKIQQRRDTAHNWSYTNPTLSSGEFGYEIDSGKLKVGNGSTQWNTLPYFAGSLSAGSTVPSNPIEYQLWFDTVSGRMFIYFSNTWVDTNPETGGAVSITSNDVAPSTPEVNDLWYDTSRGRLYLNYRGNWKDTNPIADNSLRYCISIGRSLLDQTNSQSLFGVGVQLESDTRYDYKITGTVYKEETSPTVLQYTLSGTAELEKHIFTVLCSESLTRNNSLGSTTNQPALSSDALYSNFDTLVDISSGAVTGSTYYNFVISGIIDITTSGTFNPHIAFDNLPGNSVVMPGTRIDLVPVGDITGVNTSIGQWTA